MSGLIDFAQAVAIIVPAIGAAWGAWAIQQGKVRKQKQDADAARSDFHRLIRERDEARAEAAIEREAQEQAAIALAALKKDNMYLRRLREEAERRVPESERSYFKPTNYGGIDGPEK